MKNTFAYVLTGEQFAAAIQYRNQYLLKRTRVRRLMQLAGIVAWIATGVALFVSHEPGGSSVVRISLYVMAAGYSLYYLLYGRALDQLYRIDNYLVGVPTELRVEDDGLYHSSPSCRSLITWPGLRVIDEADGVLLLGLDKLHILAMPASVFESPEEKDRFVAYLKEKREAAGSAVVSNVNLPPPSFATPPNDVTVEFEPVEQHWSALKKNLFNAVKLAFGGRVALERLVISWWQVIAFAALGLVPPLIYDLAANGIHGEIAWGNVPDALFHLPIFLVAAVATAYALGRGQRTQWLFQIMLMIAFVVDSAYYSLYSIPLSGRPRQWLSYSGSYLYVFSLMWLVIACSKATLERVSVPVYRRFWAAIALGLLIIYPLTEIARERDLWLPASSAQEIEESTSFGRLGEDTLYNQRDALDRQLAAVTPGHSGIINLFFIGVAGYGSQNVFMKEVDAVSELFQKRFGAADKTIRLINNRKNPNGAPLASVTSLRAALTRVAAVMDKNKDLLFLFLTSHGSQDHRFSLDLWPIKFQELDPARLRQLLDDSGIKYRVIVISACYSGGFVDALKNDDTLVITASAQDKNSFGCSNEAEWTYFGKAYFDEALRHTYSFVKAFELAKPVIADRERKEDFTPSEPQMALGRAIEPKLAQLENQLNAKK